MHVARALRTLGRPSDIHKTGVLVGAVLVLFAAVAASAPSADRPPLPPGLEPGPFAVGFVVQQHVDQSRTYGTRPDRAGRTNARDGARPIQLSIWYPAATEGRFHFLTYGDYVETLDAEIGVDDSDGFRRRRFLVGIRIGAFGPEGGDAGDDARLKRVLKRSAFAIKDARPRPGRFPVLVYVPSVASQSFENSPLCEFLASHGYVVVAFPSNGYDSRDTPTKASDVEALIRDAEFALEKGRLFANADSNRAGVIGCSWGGMVGLYLAARNARVDAHVSIDGAETVPELDESVRGRFPFYDAVATARVSSLVMIDAGTGRSTDVRIYDRMRYADTHIVRFLSVDHGDFSALSRWALVLRKEAPSEGIARFDAIYALVGRYVLDFVAAHVAGDRRAGALLESTPETNGIAAGVVTVESRRGVPRPPMGEDFLRIVRTRGVNAARHIWAEARTTDSGIVLCSAKDLFVTGQDAYLRGRTREAIAIFELAADEFAAGSPAGQRSRLYESLGRAYRRIGDLERAGAFLRKAVDANPDNAAARKLLDEVRGSERRNLVTATRHVVSMLAVLVRVLP